MLAMLLNVTKPINGTARSPKGKRKGKPYAKREKRRRHTRKHMYLFKVHVNRAKGNVLA